MQFTTFALSALSIGSALAQQQIKVHVVRVGSAKGELTFSPDNMKAAPGDMVQFQFAPANHTVTQSNFDNPCQPIAMHTNLTGVYSGFMPVQASAEMTPTYTIMINNTAPMWLYCSQGKHCQNGMTMVINENTGANATRSLSNYKLGAKAATANLPGGPIADGVAGNTTTPTGGNSGSGSGTSGGSDSGSAGTGGGAGTTGGAATTSAGPAQATGMASSMSASRSLALGGLVAFAMALFV